ncbi:MAG TPA: FAD-dependent oxidoreductase [Terriglobales bacterium]|nr:FAD-dependent oxidoreductase [Terriglobales bacterium]
MYDLAVIGGGPAGAAAAWTAARGGWRVAILERGAFPRDKVCGEYFSPEALPLLREMAPQLIPASPEIATAAFVSNAGGRREFKLPEAARGISRLALDAALWHAAGSAGAVLMPNAILRGAAHRGDSFELTVGTEPPLRARHLIIAAGRWWRIEGFGVPAVSNPSPWIGVKARLHTAQPQGLEMYLFPGGYCGLAPVENGWTNACCLVHRDHVRGLIGSADFVAWITRIAGTPLGGRLRGAEIATPMVTTAPVELGPRAATAGSALLAGDACGFIDPFTGDGMARALLSGALAAECVVTRRGGEYPAALAHAAGGSFRASSWLRSVLALPGWMQSPLLTLLAAPSIGPRLVARTRWRCW